jgi:hypothetical protein
MTKTILAALLLMLTPALAYAGARVDRIAIIEYGVYDTVTEAYTVDAQGMRENAEADIHLRRTTTIIPARPGLAFGLTYRLEGAPAGDGAEVRWIVRFPPGGLHPKGKPPLTMLDRPGQIVPIGEEMFCDYKFDEPWELAPGPWTFEFWVDGRKLASKTFIVVADGAPIS